MKPNWKKKYEETTGLLKLCRDGNKILQAERDEEKYYREAYQKELKDRPNVEKIVEKEVLPNWVIFMFSLLLLGYATVGILSFSTIKKLQQPILQPYKGPVMVPGGVSDEVFNSLELELISCKSKLMDCNHDYRHMRQQGCNP